MLTNESKNGKEVKSHKREVFVPLTFKEEVEVVKSCADGETYPHCQCNVNNLFHCIQLFFHIFFLR